MRGCRVHEMTFELILMFVPAVKAAGISGVSVRVFWENVLVKF